MEKYNFRIIDGQKIFLLKETEWIFLLQNEEYDIFKFGKSIVKVLKNIDYPIYKMYDNILLGIGFVPTGFSLPYTFLKINNYKYLRVQIENKICYSCKTKVIIGNPKVLNIYVGSPFDRFNLLRDSNSYLKPECPNCSLEVFPNSVWSVIG